MMFAAYIESWSYYFDSFNVFCYFCSARRRLAEGGHRLLCFFLF